jgi:phosphohistidine phosphatase SixA
MFTWFRGIWGSMHSVCGFTDGRRRCAVFVLVRHGVAVKKQRWHGADEERPLNGRGLRQAQELVGVLSTLGVTRLLSSPTQRCWMTLAPASNELAVPIDFSEALAAGAPVADLLRLLDSPSVENAALCTHGETFSALSRAWAATWPGASTAPDLSATPKGGCWVVEDYGTAAAAARCVDEPPIRAH